MAKISEEKKTAIKKYGEVFTPLELVDEMLDKLPVEVWGDPKLTWLDPAMGDGNFLVRVYARLFDGLAVVMPDEALRRRHILENMIYGVEIQEKHYLAAKKRLDPLDEFSIHLACADALKFDYWDDKPYPFGKI